MKLKELKKEYEKSKCEDCYSIEDYLDKVCLKKIDMYYSGWECDTVSWLMKDGTIFATEHGQLYVMSYKEFKRYKQNMKNVYKELKAIDKTIKSLEG